MSYDTFSLLVDGNWCERDATRRFRFLEPRRRASSFAFAFVRSARAQCCPPPYAPFKPEKICGVAPSLEYIERNVRRTT